MSLASSKKLETNKYELTVSVDAEKFAQAIERAYRKNVKKINVPGFRKGKAPRKMIEKLYGEGIFFEDAVNDVYPDALNEAVKEAELVLVTRPEVEATDVSREKGVEFKATCITKPEVTVKDYKGIKVTKTVKKVTDEDINEELKKLQDRNSRMVDVDDRPAKDGDNTVIDFEGFVDGKAFDGGKAEKFSLVLGSGQFIPGFEDQIVGHSVGDEFDVNVKFPEDYQAEELKGKDAVFKVKLHEIQYKEVPELDDEFAKDVSEFDTLAELKDDTSKKIAEQYEKQADTEAEDKMIDEVIANMEAEIPEVMYENRIDESVREYEYRLSAQGLDLNTYLQYTGMTMEDFRKGFKEQAEKQVKIRLALEEIVKTEDIKPSDEEIEEEYNKMASAYNMEVEKVKNVVAKDDLALDLAVGKAIDFIKENAEITSKAPAKKTASKTASKSTAAKSTAKKSTGTKSSAKKAEAAKEDKSETKTAAKKPAAKKSTTSKSTTAKKTTEKKDSADKAE